MSAENNKLFPFDLGGLIEYECITLSQSQKAKYYSANHRAIILLNEKVIRRVDDNLLKIILNYFRFFMLMLRLLIL